jgi:hypothetical protein
MKARRNLVATGASAALLLCLLAALLYRWLERSGEFDLESVRVYGCRPADSAAIAEALEPCIGQPLGRMDLQALRAALEHLGGFESATLRRDWPDAVGLEIRLSRPVLVLARGEWRSAVSDRGMNLPDTFLSDTLPVFEVSGSPDSAVLREVVAWASGGVPEGVDQFRIDGDCVKAVVSGKTLLLGDGDFSRRLAAFFEAEDSGLLGPGWDEADLRYDGQVVLRSIGGQGVTM